MPASSYRTKRVIKAKLHLPACYGLAFNTFKMETTVKITWDNPEEQQWLCADNIKIALSQHCKNTKFEVVEISTPKDFKQRLNEERIQLQDKVEKLESFLQTDKAKEVGEFQLTMLNIQLSSMYCYLQCLNARIEQL